MRDRAAALASTRLGTPARSTQESRRRRHSRQRHARSPRSPVQRMRQAAQMEDSLERYVRWPFGDPCNSEFRILNSEFQVSSDLPAIVRPVQHCLSLAASASEVSSFAMLPNGCHMPCDGPPSTNLASIVSRAAAHVVSAIPLKPASRILRLNPAISTPGRERLRGIHAEVIQFRIVPCRAQLRVREPARWKFRAAIRHVFSTEHTQLQHLPGRELGAKDRIEVTADWLRSVIRITTLHPIVDDDAFFHCARAIALWTT